MNAQARAEKVRENRLRRAAQRQGYTLQKSRRRDPRAVDYGSWWVFDASTNALVVGGQFGCSLDTVEDFLLHGFDEADT